MNMKLIMHNFTDVYFLFHRFHEFLYCFPPIFEQFLDSLLVRIFFSFCINNWNQTTMWKRDRCAFNASTAYLYLGIFLKILKSIFRGFHKIKFQMWVHHPAQKIGLRMCSIRVPPDSIVRRNNGLIYSCWRYWRSGGFSAPSQKIIQL